MSDILVVRLISGEEILGDVELNHSETHVKIKHPTRVAAGPNPNTGQVDVHMVPLLTLAQEKEVTLSKSAIVFTYTPVVEIRNKFSTLFGSGIVVPT